jgi:thioredoxin reductase (NADPH)
MKLESMYEILIVGAGPAGIGLAVEAVKSGIASNKILLVEKYKEHSWAIRKFYPDSKLVTANYKGLSVGCKGSLCLTDSSKKETLDYLDECIETHNLQIHYEQQVGEVCRLKTGYYQVKTSNEVYLTKTVVMAIGVLGRPNRPSYPLPKDCLPQIHFDVTSKKISGKKVLVVGGGDSASEYVQYLVEKNNDVTLSYRKKEFARMNDINLSKLMKLESESKAVILRSSDISELARKENSVEVHYHTDHPSQLFDEVIYALGGSSPKDFLKAAGITISHEGPELSEYYESNMEGIFVIGDISAGNKGGSINMAFNSAYDAMKELGRSYLDAL